MKPLQIAFVGNPNVGKSAWINALSNADFKIGNWPGVTVEKKEASVNWNGQEYHLIDLPGTYSLEANHNEESITARYLKEEKVDLIVNIVDATNLSRNLLLTLLLRDLQIPMIMIFNFMDEVQKYHIHIEIAKLSRRLQLTILPYSAFDQEHYEDVKKAIIKGVQQDVFYYPLLLHEDEERYVALYNYIEREMPASLKKKEAMLHTLCVGILEEREETHKQLSLWHINLHQIEILRQGHTKERMKQRRFEIIASLMRHVKEDTNRRYAKARKLDRFFLHRYAGMPVFFIIFTFLLLFVFQASAPFNDFIDFLINDILVKYVAYFMQDLPDVLQQFILKGIIAGVGGVLVFIPLMGILYFVLALLEESGYMSRIAFLLDRMMHYFHLSGKSFVSLLLGFGCNVPAIYATRSLDNEKQKKMTALLIPFMSCGARLPVYVLFAAAFFPDKAGMMIVSVYGIGILMALLLALLFSKHKTFQEHDLFVLELPPYRLPNLRVVWRKVKGEVGSYIKKATGIVLWAMIIIWSFSYFPNGRLEASYIAHASKAITPIFEPLGFGERWECIASLPGGIIAKETIVGFFEQVIGDEKREQPKQLEPLQDMRLVSERFLITVKDSATSIIVPSIKLKPTTDSQVNVMRSLFQGDKAQLKAFSFMVYVLLSIPCIMTLQAIYHEYGKKLLCLSLMSGLILPYMVSLFIYQFFSLFY